MDEAKKKNVLAVWEIRQVCLVYYDKAKAALKGNHFITGYSRVCFPRCPSDPETDNVDFEIESWYCGSQLFSRISVLGSSHPVT